MAAGANRLEQIDAAWTAPLVPAARVVILNLGGPQNLWSTYRIGPQAILYGLKQTNPWPVVHRCISEYRSGHGVHGGAQCKAKTHVDTFTNVWSALSTLSSPLKGLVSEPSKTLLSSKCLCMG